MASVGISNTSEWEMSREPVLLRGMGYGLYLPSLRLTLKGRILNTDARLAGLESLARLHPALINLPRRSELIAAQNDVAEDWPGTVQWLLSLWQCIQDMLGAPITEKGKTIRLFEGGAVCVVPIIATCAPAMRGLLLSSIRIVTLQQSAVNEDLQHRAAFQQVLISLQANLKTSSNVPMFLKAARHMRLPFLELPGRHWQFGIGRRARWLDSSYTDVTPVMAHKLSKRKDYAATMLRDAGIPVPDHALVRDGDHAVRVSKQLKYPVVVKPADQDGGRGVFADLSTAEEVLLAHAKAAKLSSNVLVERHVPGRDYRVVVFQGQVTFAIERKPASVTGDGVSSVAELLQKRNAEALEVQPPRPQLSLDEEALRLLEREGLSRDSIPASGLRVRLRSAANYAIGGTAEVVTDLVHPDNAQLAVRAAEALRLDLAGIDLIMSDISLSWHEVGSAVCEVNGQPQLGRNSSAHLYGDVLQALVPGDGRMPTVIVLGEADIVKPLMKQVVQALVAHEMVVGTAGPEGIRVGDELISNAQDPIAQRMRVLAFNRRVEAIVVGLCDDSVLIQGLPFARFDWLFLANPLKTVDDGLLRLLLPACDGTVFCDQPYLGVIDGLKRHAGANVKALLPSGQQLIDEVNKLVARHLMGQPTANTDDVK